MGKPVRTVGDRTKQVEFNFFFPCVGVKCPAVCRQALQWGDRYVVRIIGPAITVIWPLNEDNQLSL